MENSNWLEHIEIVITTPMSHNACSRERQSWAADAGGYAESSIDCKPYGVISYMNRNKRQMNNQPNQNKNQSKVIDTNVEEYYVYDFAGPMEG
jgi:hypothetical protein